MDATDEAIMDAKRQVHLSTQLEKSLTDALKVLNEDEEKEIEEFLRELESLKEIPPLKSKIEEFRDESKKDDSKLELKMPPSHLKYVFLEEGGHKPVIIINALSNNEEQKLIEVLNKNKKAMG